MLHCRRIPSPPLPHSILPIVSSSFSSLFRQSIDFNVLAKTSFRHFIPTFLSPCRTFFRISTATHNTITAASFYLANKSISFQFVFSFLMWGCDLLCCCCMLHCPSEKTLANNNNNTLTVIMAILIWSLFFHIICYYHHFFLFSFCGELLYRPAAPSPSSLKHFLLLNRKTLLNCLSSFAVA